MNNGKRMPLLALALVLVMGLTACGGEKSGLTETNAADYVAGLLEESYLGTAGEEYKRLMDKDDEDVTEVYEQSMAVEADFFIYHYSIENPTEELHEEVEELCREIYSHAKFQVVSAAEQSDGSFSVKVTVEPIDIAHLVEEELKEALEPWYEKYPTEVQDRMSDEEYQSADEEWARIIVDTVKAKLPETGNLEERSTSVQIEKTEEGTYVLTQEDFDRLDAMILDYPYNED